jgi:hypothetical protein
MNLKNNSIIFLFPVIFTLFFSSCSKMGYGILLWANEDPQIFSGTVLPVYIRSNIDHVWVVGVPNDSKLIEVPLLLFEFSGSKRKANKRADEFAHYAPVYAQNLQDGLPIRDAPDNGSRRVYRLRPGEIIKVLDKVEGNPPISTTGDPLPGDWFSVLTHEGIKGYCFSYRLKIFEHNSGPLLAAPSALKETAPDPELEMVLSKKWSSEAYQQMINTRRININDLEKDYRFDPGQDTGIAKIILPDIQKEFIYEGIYPDGEQAWRFEGANLQMNLRTNTTLAVQYVEDTGSRRTLLFNSLSSDIDDIIVQENNRREAQISALYNYGPVFTSNHYGTISLSETGELTWTGFDLLVPQYIPNTSRGKGRVIMDIFLSNTLAEQYTGALTFRFTDVTPNRNICFMYDLDSQGLRLEIAPASSIEDVTVTRRAPSPMVMYFYRDLLP